MLSCGQLLQPHKDHSQGLSIREQWQKMKASETSKTSPVGSVIATSSHFGNFANYAHLGKGTQAQALASTCRHNIEWVVDSGASKHVTGISSSFKTYTPHSYTETIQTADGTSQPIHGVGSIECTPSLHLSSVLHVPSFPVNLLSVSSLVDQFKCIVTFDENVCVFQEKRTGRVIGTGVRRNGLWFINQAESALAAAVGEQEKEIILLHCRYSTVIETLPSAISYSPNGELQPTLQKMRILVGHPLKQPPNYTSEDFMVPVMTSADSTPDFGFETFFEDKECCKGLSGFLIYGTSDFVTVCKEVYVRTRRVRLLGLEGAGKTSLLKAMLGQVKERSSAVLECIHVDLHGKGISSGLCYIDSTVNLQELPLEVRRFKEELLLGLHDLNRKTDLIIAVHNLAHRIPQYQQSSTFQPQPALSLFLDEAKALSIPWILAITNKFSVSVHEQDKLISSAMEAYHASPEITKVVNSSPFLMPSARNSLQRIGSAVRNLGNKDPANRSNYLPVNFALSPFQRNDIVMHVEGVSALRQLVHQVVLNNEEPAFEELARERLLQELAREKAASLQVKQKPRKRDGSVTAAAVGASLGAGLGIVMAVIMGAASALRKP